jgi:hypothetical protein
MDTIDLIPFVILIRLLMHSKVCRTIFCECIFHPFSHSTIYLDGEGNITVERGRKPGKHPDYSVHSMEEHDDTYR